VDLDADCGERVSAFARHDGDQATAARTIGELKAEIATLGRLQSLAHIVRGSGADRKWKELASLLGEIFNGPPNSNDGPSKNSAPGNSTIPRAKPSPRQKLVVFTEHRDTLSYLKGRVTTLLGRGEAVVVSARLRGLSGVPDFG
jgi:hypothetical protein